MEFLQELMVSSTSHFLWDDPTKETEVRQLAFDFGNAVYCGKFNDSRVLQTDCLVTANFNLTEIEK